MSDSFAALLKERFEPLIGFEGSSDMHQPAILVGAPSKSIPRSALAGSNRGGNGELLRTAVEYALTQGSQTTGVAATGQTV
jgi:hypothetical protein